MFNLIIHARDCLAGDDDDGDGMGQTYMQKRSLFKESSERRVRAEQRKIKVGTRRERQGHG